MALARAPPLAGLALALALAVCAAPAAAQSSFGFGSNYGSSYTGSSRPSYGAFTAPTGYPSSGGYRAAPSSSSGYRPQAGSSLPTMPVRTSGSSSPSSYSSPSMPSFASGGSYRRRTGSAIPFAMGAFAGVAGEASSPGGAFGQAHPWASEPAALPPAACARPGTGRPEYSLPSAMACALNTLSAPRHRRLLHARQQPKCILQRPQPRVLQEYLRARAERLPGRARQAAAAGALPQLPRQGVHRVLDDP